MKYVFNQLKTCFKMEISIFIVVGALALVSFITGAKDLDQLEKQFWDAWGDTGKAKWGDLLQWTKEYRFHYCTEFHKEAYEEKIPELLYIPPSFASTLTVSFHSETSKKLGFYRKRIYNVETIYCNFIDLMYKNPEEKIANEIDYFITKRKNRNCLLQIFQEYYKYKNYKRGGPKYFELPTDRYYLADEICWKEDPPNKASTNQSESASHLLHKISESLSQEIESGNEDETNKADLLSWNKIIRQTEIFTEDDGKDCAQNTEKAYIEQYEQPKTQQENKNEDKKDNKKDQRRDKRQIEKELSENAIIIIHEEERRKEVRNDDVDNSRNRRSEVGANQNRENAKEMKTETKEFVNEDEGNSANGENEEKGYAIKDEKVKEILNNVVECMKAEVKYESKINKENEKECEDENNEQKEQCLDKHPNEEKLSINVNIITREENGKGKEKEKDEENEVENNDVDSYRNKEEEVGYNDIREVGEEIKNIIKEFMSENEGTNTNEDKEEGCSIHDEEIQEIEDDAKEYEKRNVEDETRADRDKVENREGEKQCHDTYQDEEKLSRNGNTITQKEKGKREIRNNDEENSVKNEDEIDENESEENVVEMKTNLSEVINQDIGNNASGTRQVEEYAMNDEDMICLRKEKEEFVKHFVENTEYEGQKNDKYLQPKAGINNCIDSDSDDDCSMSQESSFGIPDKIIGMFSDDDSINESIADPIANMSDDEISFGTTKSKADSIKNMSGDEGLSTADMIVNILYDEESDTEASKIACLSTDDESYFSPTEFEDDKNINQCNKVNKS